MHERVALLVQTDLPQVFYKYSSVWPEMHEHVALLVQTDLPQVFYAWQQVSVWWACKNDVWGGEGGESVPGLQKLTLIKRQSKCYHFQVVINHCCLPDILRWCILRGQYSRIFYYFHRVINHCSQPDILRWCNLRGQYFRIFSYFQVVINHCQIFWGVYSYRSLL